MLNVIDFDMNLAQAEMAGRIHHQWVPDEVEYEKGAIVYDGYKNLVDVVTNLSRAHTSAKFKLSS